jgi:cell filamentation protein
MPDRYTYPGTETLRNKRGITDPGLLRAVETTLTFQRMIALERSPIAGDFDLEHLRTIHRFLLSPLFDFAGEIRTTDTGPGGTGIAHCRPEFILPEADRIFTTLVDADYLRHLDRAAFSAGLAETWGEVSALHPFRDGNTRSQWVFFNRLAEHAGWVIDWDLIDVRVFAHARTVAIIRDSEGLDALLYPALLSVEEARSRGQIDRLTHQSSYFARDTSSLPSLAELDAALHQALQRRAAQLGQPDEHDNDNDHRHIGRDTPGLDR